ncbi:MAG: hypothetical protein H7836_04435 [Magnetococcus sp. YQC-3]
MFGATTPATTQTPEQYWNALTLSQQTYLRNIVLKKNLPILVGLIGLGAALAFVAAKKKMI